MATTQEVKTALAKRYQMPKWVLVSEAPSENVGGGWCDAVAFGVWRSSKNEIIGHEVKVSRSDWLREIERPDKSDQFIPYCDRWYIVAPPKIVKLEELRSTWGLMELTGNGLKIRRQAEKTEVETMPRNMLAAMLRKVASGASREEIERIRQTEKDAAKSMAKWETERLTKELDRLRESVRQFEQASGVQIDRWRGNQQVGEAVNAIINRPSAKSREFHAIAERYERIAAMARNAGEELQKLLADDDMVA